MPASLSRHDRSNRSIANKAANRLSRESAVFRLSLNLVNHKWRQRESELGRDLLHEEAESLCAALGSDDLVAFIKELP